LINIHKTYPSKLLLFGEYTVTQGSAAMALPLSAYGGHWQLNSSNTSSLEGLLRLYNYLVENDSGQSLIDKEAFKIAINDGWIFNSNIPQGYGLGSSGALVAAVYDAFAHNKSDNLSWLKDQLAYLENAFHGNSSGIDPLVSYTDSLIIIESHGNIRIEKKPNTNFKLFLLDSGVSRSTAPLVDVFKNKMSHLTGFYEKIQELISINEKAIQAYLDENTMDLWNHFLDISHIQWSHFQEMILPDWHSIWKEGLSNKEYAIKICGAGGGGMILGMINPKNSIQTHIGQMKTIEL